MKKLLTFALMLSVTASAMADACGKCGANLTWTYIEETKTLKIEGSGGMSYYDGYNGPKTTPWANYEINTVVFDPYVTSIGAGAFRSISTLTTVSIPYGVTSIGSSAFSDCTGLTSINIPSSVGTIGSNAFAGCSGLTSITIPKTVSSIGDFAFAGCSGLTSIKVESGNKYYDSRNNCNAIINTETKELIVGCKNTIIPYGVTIIGGGAFWGCSGLTSINIPYSVVFIRTNAFYNCTGLTSVILSGQVETIQSSAFEGCYSLTSIEIPSSVRDIAPDVFTGCSGLCSITVANGNRVYDSRDNCNAIIESASNTLKFGCKNTVIPNTITEIDGAFRGCTSLTSINIPNSVTTIQSAFINCTGLKSINIPSSVKRIGTSAFSGCTSLRAITITRGVTSIDNHAFFNCSGLKSVRIQNSVTTIGYDAFNGCSSLTSITIPKSVTYIGQRAFEGCNFQTVNSLIEEPFTILGKTAEYGGCFSENTFENANLFVPEGTIDKYKAAKGWRDFQNIYEGDPSGVTEVKASPLVIQSSGSQLSIDGVPAGSDVAVYDLNGRLIGQTKAAATGTTKVAVPAGEKMLIVKVGEKSVKVVNK